MIEEYVLTNDDGEKIYLHFSNSGNKAVINSVSINDYENEGNPNYIDKKELVEFIKELINSKGEPAAYGNSKVKHFVNKELMKPLIIEGKPYPDDFVESIYGSGYKFKNCEKIQRLSTPVKDKEEQIDSSNAVRFQYYVNCSSFEGRTAELGFLSDMCDNTDAPFYWTFICGEGGIGKSRLAYELCNRLSKKGWIVYRPSHARIKAEQIKNDIGKTDKDMVICFDDVNSDIEIVLDFMNYCIETTFKKSQKIRLLLIDREFVDYPIMASNAPLYRYQGNKKGDLKVETVNGCLKVNHPSTEETFIIMRSFVKKIYKIDLPRSTFDTILYPGLKQIDKKNERPLFALLIADGWASLETKWKGKIIGYTYPSDVLETLYLNECRRIRELIEMEYKPSKQEKALEAAKCCITLSSFLDESSAYKHIEIISEVTHFEIEDNFYWVMEQAGYMKDGTLFNPFPDIVSEYFSLKYINSISNKNHLITLIDYLLREGKTRTLNYTKQICNDYSDILFSPSNMSIFQHLIGMYKTIHFWQWDFLIGLSVQTQQAFLHHNTSDNEFESFKRQIKNMISSYSDYSRIDYPIDIGFHLGIYGEVGVHNELKKELSKYPDNIAMDFENISAELIISFFEQNKDKIFIDSDDPVLNGALSLSKYHGQLLFGYRWGKGKFETSDGSTYEGEWNMNCANGKGIEVSPLGTYDGSWEDGRKCGYGRMTYSDGTEYEGEWFYGGRYGHGKITSPSKEPYECDWQDNLPLDKKRNSVI